MITVINMIPATLSGETSQDSEPNLAVNHADPSVIVGTAFSPNPGGGSNGPIYVSTNGGTSWTVNAVVPSQAGSGSGTGDITTAFGWDGTNRLYAGILRRPGGLRLNILRTNNATLATVMTVLEDRTGSGVDQPYIKTGRVFRGTGVFNDRVYVGNNDFNQPAGMTASVDVSLAGIAAAPPPPANFTTDRIERRGTSGQDGPPIRPAVHIDGTIYAAFYRWTAFVGGVATADVTVVRDDNWAAGANPFSALTDPGDGLAGRFVVQGVTVPFNTGQAFGQERFVASDLSVAVDPRDSNNVWIAWADQTAGNYNLHVRRSADRGQNWSAADLRFIANAKNPALAVNSRGKVAFAYQQLTGAGAAQRWLSTLERSTDNFATVPTVDVLSNTPNNAPARLFGPYLGDYIGLQSVGQDFFGVFSANNSPNNANFPQGVSYQRNASFTTNTLFANDGVTPVAISIDPFFFHAQEIAPAEDFYVADWTDSAASFDLGVEPSIDPVFYKTSDVWNRRTDAPGGFDANNRPINEDPQQGGPAGPNNYSFARIRRRGDGAPGSVTAHFLTSEFGTGSNYLDSGADPDPIVNFATGDGVITMAAGYPWRLPPTASTHFCMAVEVSAPTDPIVAPSVLGRAPGWPTTDLLFINDNNKAQRNMGVGPMVAGGWITYFGTIHNAAIFLRDFILDYRITSPLDKAVLHVSGQRDRALRDEGTLVLKGMRPGENRWVGVTLPVGKARSTQSVTFTERLGTKELNGFAIEAKQAEWDEAARFYLDLQADTAARLADGFGVKEFSEVGCKARELAASKRLSPKGYAGAVLEAAERFGVVVALGKEMGLRDPFRVSDAIEKLHGARQGVGFLAAHAELLQRAGTHLTMVAKANGDVADILQTLVYQIEVFRSEELERLEPARVVLASTTDFADAFQVRKVGVADYPSLVESLLGDFSKTADSVGSKALHDAVERMAEFLHDPALIQGANMEFVIALDQLV